MQFLYGDPFTKMIKPYAKGVKRTTHDDEDDEPPTTRSNVGKQSDKDKEKKKLVRDLVATGYTREEAEKVVVV